MMTRRSKDDVSLSKGFAKGERDGLKSGFDILAKCLEA